MRSQTLLTPKEKCTLLHNHWTEFYKPRVLPEVRSNAKKMAVGSGGIGVELSKYIWDCAVVVMMTLRMVIGSVGVVEVNKNGHCGMSFGVGTW
jgi:hypothetical protein